MDQDLPLTGARYDCASPARRAALLAPTAPPGLSGIDYLEVAQGNSTNDPTHITLVLVKPVARAAITLTGANIRITGGVRFGPPRPAPVLDLLPASGPVSAIRITLPGGQQTDFSTYHLAVVKREGAHEPPDFLDPRLAALAFSFKAGCPSDLDCAPDCDPDPAPAAPGPAYDYRIRDWPGFRQMMLDRMADLVPGFRGDDPADLTTTLIEALAAEADRMSYRLDWAGTEGLFQTARSPASVRRHARLVDYTPSGGASARVFVQLHPGAGSPADGADIPAATPLLIRQTGRASLPGPADYRAALVGAEPVFETCAALRIWEWQAQIAFHTWSDSACRLPVGATSATLIDDSNGAGGLQPGDFLLLAENRSPETGAIADASPARRHPVRLTAVRSESDPLAPGLALVTVDWDRADALPFALDLGPSAAPFAMASGNMMLADHGASLPPGSGLGLSSPDMAALSLRLSPPEAPPSGRWRPRLTDASGMAPGALSQIAPADLALGVPAQALRRPDPAACLPALRLEEDFAPWQARRDLIGTGPFGRGFVTEAGVDGAVLLRFGDGRDGLAPAGGTSLTVQARIGSGPQGNIGADALGHAVLPAALASGWPEGSLQITNPLPAEGGTAPEPMVQTRLNAPQAFRRQERAVTAADYAQCAMRHPEVANALARPRWTGAWQVMQIHVDRKGGAPVDAAFRTRLARHMEHYRLMGVDVSIRPAEAAPLDIALTICTKPGAIRPQVERALRRALSPGANGFFHPDRFTFGTALALSALILAAMAVPGVQSVTATRFGRFGRPAMGELERGLILPVGPEILQLSDDPSLPEQGRLVLTMAGLA